MVSINNHSTQFHTTPSFLGGGGGEESLSSGVTIMNLINHSHIKRALQKAKPRRHFSTAVFTNTTLSHPTPTAVPALLTPSPRIL